MSYTSWRTRNSLGRFLTTLRVECDQCGFFLRYTKFQLPVSASPSKKTLMKHARAEGWRLGHWTQCPACSGKSDTVPTSFFVVYECEHGCHFQKPYGFVPMADCPYHDK